MTTAARLQLTLDTKNAIKLALQNKGATPSDVFSTYPAIIDTLETEVEGIITPAIIFPADGDTEIKQSSLTMESTCFASNPAGEYVHSLSQWQIATDAEFTNVIWDSGQDYINLTSIDVPEGVMNPNTMYYARVRYDGGLRGTITFYESRVGVNIDLIEVYVVDDAGSPQSGIVYTDQGEKSGDWNKVRAYFPIPSLPYRIAWRYRNGTSWRGDYAIDTVSINGVIKDFSAGNEGFITTSGINTTDPVAARANAVAVPTTTAATLGRFNRNSGGTPSSGTGPSGAQSGTHYIYFESTSPNNSTVNGWLFSDLINP